MHGLRNRSSLLAPRSSLHAPRGFTLIELLAVLAVIGMMLVIAVLNVDWMVPRYALRGEAHKIAGLCSMARSYAVARGAAFYISYDTKNNKVTLYGPKPPDNQEDPVGAAEFIPVPAVAPATQWEVAATEDFTNGVTFEDVWVGASAAAGDIVQVEFSPLGTTDSHTVHLRGQDGSEMTVDINGVTSAPTYYEQRWEPQPLQQADQ